MLHFQISIKMCTFVQKNQPMYRTDIYIKKYKKFHARRLFECWIFY